MEATDHRPRWARRGLRVRLGFGAALLGFCSSTATLAQNNGNNPAQSLSNHPGWVQAPGMLIRPDCVHEIPKGARVEVKGDTVTGDITLGGATVAHYEPCSEAPVITRPLGGRSSNLANPPGTGNGWVEAVQKAVPLGAGDNIDYIGGSWVVPPNPSALGALIYLFNGIEPTNQQWILQPVLQWGSNGAFGGDYWVIATWLVGPNNFAFYSTPEQVFVGDTIAGFTKITPGGFYQVWAVDVTKPTVTTSGNLPSFSGLPGFQWKWAYAGVLEAYGVTSCSQFPASFDTVFQNVYVYHGYPNYLSDSTAWSGVVYPYGGPNCGLIGGFFAVGYGSNPARAYLAY
jgi:hypothetical protein